MTRAWLGRAASILAEALLLAGCQLGASQPPTRLPVAATVQDDNVSHLLLATPSVANTPRPRNTPTAITTAVPVPTQTAPTAIPPQPSTTPTFPEPVVALTRDGTGYRIDGKAPGFDGTLYLAGWMDPSHLVLTWRFHDQKGLHPTASYLADLSNVQMHRLIMPGIGRVIPREDGKKAILLPEYDAPRNISLLDVATAHMETVLSTDSSLVQWTTNRQRQEVLDDVRDVLGDATWITKDAFVLKFPLKSVQDPGLAYTAPGRLVLVQSQAHKVRVLAKEGELAAVLPSGRLLLRPGWLGGPLQVLVPPYDSPPIQIARAGPWTERWAVSANGQYIAWFEMDDPAPTRGRFLPEWFRSAGPIPPVRTLAIWDRTKGRVRHFPVSGVHWPQIRLRWRNDNSALLFSGAPPDNPEHTALFEITRDGIITLLARYSGDGVVTFLAEGKDRSLYYTIAQSINWNPYWDPRLPTQLTRRYPDGKLEVLPELENENNSYYLEQPGILITEKVVHPQTELTIRELGSNDVRIMQTALNPTLSKDGQWLVHSVWGGPVFIIPTK
jgi:hypothetical protein